MVKAMELTFTGRAYLLSITLHQYLRGETFSATAVATAYMIKIPDHRLDWYIYRLNRKLQKTDAKKGALSSLVLLLHERFLGKFDKSVQLSAVFTHAMEQRLVVGDQGVRIIVLNNTTGVHYQNLVVINDGS